MWWFIVSIVLIVLTIGIMKGTHISIYYKFSKPSPTLEKEYGFPVYVWRILLVILIGCIPILNIVIFVIFISYWVYFASNNPNKGLGNVTVYRLTDNNPIAKSLIFIGKLMSKKL